MNNSLDFIPFRHAPSFGVIWTFSVSTCIPAVVGCKGRERGKTKPDRIVEDAKTALPNSVENVLDPLAHVERLSCGWIFSGTENLDCMPSERRCHGPRLLQRCLISMLFLLCYLRLLPSIAFAGSGVADGWIRGGHCVLFSHRVRIWSSSCSCARAVFARIVVCVCFVMSSCIFMVS